MRWPRLRYDRILWVLSLVLIALLWLRAINTKKNKEVSKPLVTVEPLDGGSKLITEQNVLNMLAKSFGSAISQTALSQLEIDRMEKVVEADPFVQDAAVYIDQQNNLQLTIIQRNPVLRIMDANGGNYYLDKEGKKMPVSSNYTARVVVVTGKLPPHTPDFLEKRSNLLKDVFQVWQKLEEDAFLKGFIQQLHVSNNGDILMSPLIGDQIIILGSTRHLEDKLERLKVFYKQAVPYEGWRKYKTINLKYNGQIVCNKK